MSEAPLLSIRDLRVGYGPLQALAGVDLDIHAGETVALVGESGSGKSTVAMAIMDLIDPKAVSGSIRFKGEDLAALRAAERRALRGSRISLVFQDPFTSLNPAIRIGVQVAEALVAHRGTDRATAHEQAVAALAEVGIPDPEAVAGAFPHQLSGGMLQRALIASALICDPDVLLLDEPTTALDVTVEAQILDLMRAIAARRRIGILFITHNLGVVNAIADRVCVLYAGQVLEIGAKREVLSRPVHPYTKGLLASLPRLARRRDHHRLSPIEGRFPDLTHPPAGCIFEERCPFTEARCREKQALRALEGHAVRCWKAEGLAATPWPPAADHRLDVRSVADEITAKSLIEAVGITKNFIRRGQSVVWRRGPAGIPLPALSTTSFTAVDDVSLSVRRGEVIGLVGESGSGKSTLGRIMLRLIEPESGTVVFDGREVGGERDEALQRFRPRVQLVFQNPASSLNPRRTIGDIIGRVITLHGGASPTPLRERTEALLDRVGLPRRYHDRYPHQLSGGEKQRVGIARALASQPDFIVCDEPVSALDVSVQATVLNLLSDLKQDLGLSYLFISHDLAVVSHLADRIAVLYFGRIVEEGPADAVLEPPYHPYTEALLSAVSSPDPRQEQGGRIVLSGEATRRSPTGCIFQARCPRKIGAICETVAPPVVEPSPGHRIVCHLPEHELAAMQSRLHAAPAPEQPDRPQGYTA